MHDHNSKIALVTGASRGIGEAIAEELSESGYRVACAGRSMDELQRVAAKVDGLAVPMDLISGESINRALEQIRSQWGEVDVLINNAGIAHSATVADTSDEIWEQTMAVNLTGGFQLAKACLPSMVKKRWGRVIFVASNAGLSGYAYTSAYCASKHGVIGLVRSMAAELARSGITVNAICPGFVETAMAQRAMDRIEATTGRSADQARKALERMNPQNRLIQVDEVAHIAAMLVHDGARGVNGQAIAIDGGQVMH